MFTASVCAGPVPQALVAGTVIVPPVVVAVALSTLEAVEPVHPEGIVHVYDVAPLTGVAV